MESDGILEKANLCYPCFGGHNKILYNVLLFSLILEGDEKYKEVDDGLHVVKENKVSESGNK